MPLLDLSLEENVTLVPHKFLQFSVLELIADIATGKNIIVVINLSPWTDLFSIKTTPGTDSKKITENVWK